MAVGFDLATQNIAEYIRQHPDQFNGLAPGNVIAHLGKVHPDLWKQLEDSYNSEVQNPNKWAALKGGGYANAVPLAGQGFLAKSAFDIGNQGGPPTLNEWALHNPAFGTGLLDPTYNNYGYLPANSNYRPGQQPAPQVAQPDTAKVEDQALGREAEYRKKIEDIFNNAAERTTNNITRAAAPGRSKLLSEEAALGRLTSPASIASTSRYDENTQNALGNALGSLEQQKATGELDLSKTIENMLAGERRASEQVGQFNQELGLKRDALSSDVKEYYDKLSQDRQLADSSKKRDWLDYLNSGVDIASKLFGNTQTGAGSRGRGGLLF